MHSHVDLHEDEWEIVASCLKHTAFKKGALISSMGDVHDRIYYINSGLARAYTLDEEGKDFTWSIFFNDANSHMTNLFITDYESFVNKTASRLEIEALEDCEVLFLTYEDMQMLYQNSVKMLLFCKMMSDMAYAYLHHLLLDSRTKSAQERFTEFVTHTPHLLEKVPQYHIATFLGITPIHLSRLKRAYRKKRAL